MHVVSTQVVRFVEPPGDDGSISPREPAPWRPPPRPVATARPPLAVNTAPPLTDSNGEPLDSSAAGVSGRRGQGGGWDEGAGSGDLGYAPPPEPVVLAATPRAGQPSYLRAHLQVRCKHALKSQRARLQQRVVRSCWMSRCTLMWHTLPDSRPLASRRRHAACVIAVWLTCRLQRCWQRSVRSRRRSGSVPGAHQCRVQELQRWQADMLQLQLAH